ncbi:MAG: hypothetical protein IKC59_04855, partial [Clostridia bacterium]|nr:hypothetical protein [Clostridia bacterium]
MKNTWIRVIAVVMALLMTLPFLFACGKQTDEGDGQGTESVEVTLPDGVDANSEQAKYLPERKDLGGHTFKIVMDGGMGTNAQYTIPSDDASLSTDAVNIALKKRNDLLENYFNIDITIKQLGEAYQMNRQLEATSLSHEDFADIIYSVASFVMNPAISNGYVLDLLEMNELNLEASYYDQRIQEEYLINGMLFTLEGDFTVYDEMRTHVVALNKTLYENYLYNDTYGSPYQMVRDGKWTIDTMLAMIKDKSDLNSVGGSDNLTSGSRWGMISESPFPYVVYLGTGSKIVYSDEGDLTSPWKNDATYQQDYEIFEKLLPAIFNNEEILITDKRADILGDNYWTTAQGMFANGQALFATSTLSSVVQYRAMKDSFGILPIPKYTESQEYYYSWCSAMAHTPLMVPATAKNHVSTTATVIEAMAYFSKYMSGT